MMTFARSLLIALLVLCAIPHLAALTAIAQDDTGQINPLKRTALDVLAREIERAKSYGQTRERVIVWIAAADALWDSDKLRARSLLREANEQIDGAVATARQGEKEFITNARTTVLRGQLRADLLAVAQRHDPTLVDELMRGAKTEENKAQMVALHNEPQVFGSSSFQKRSLALLAARLVPTDPQQAVSYAVDSLGYGVPQEFTEVFRALIAAHPRSAHQLFEKATAYFNADSSSNLYDAMILASYLRLIPQPESDVQLVKRFLDTAFARIKRVREQSIQTGTNNEGLRSTLFLTLKQLHTFYVIYWPERAGEVRSYSQQLEQEVRPEERAAEELFPTETSRNDLDSILSRAANEKNEDNRDALYLQAALTLSRRGEYESALDTAGRARSGERREAVVTDVRRAQIQSLISQGELYEAAKAVEKIESPEERADVTIRLIAAARKKKDMVMAGDILRSTQKILVAGTGSVSQARAYLWLASSYSKIDIQTGFELMSVAIKTANGVRELEDVKSEPRYLQLGGASRLAIQVGDNKGDFRSGFRLLARHDFARTIALAESFENELLRGLSLVTAATSVLNQDTEMSARRQ